MQDISNQLSVHDERPVDPLVLMVLKLLNDCLRRAGIHYMLVGATARDLILHHVYGHAVVRATHDLDFAIVVDSWEHFSAIRTQFLAIQGFQEWSQPHRVLYRPADTQFTIPIDIIPFGGVERRDHTIAWPPNADPIMNMAAFAEVLAGALVIEIEPKILIPVPSLAGLILLKLFAWIDRRDARDVSDIRRILETYSDAGNADRLYEEEFAELERVGFDTILAGAYLLGKDAKLIVTEETLKSLSLALSADMMEELAGSMARSMSRFDDRTEEASTLLRSFCRGIGMSDLF